MLSKHKVKNSFEYFKQCSIAKSKREVEIEAKQLACPKGHPMKLLVGVRESWFSYHTCSGCGVKIANKYGPNPKAPYRRCNECDYDLCAQCALSYDDNRDEYFRQESL